MDYHFIYLIKEKDDIDNDVQIYKIGKSCQANTKRVASYPSGSHLLLQVACDDCHSMETLLIKEFKYLFKLARGREYFGGDPYKMINLIFFIVQIEVNPHKIEYMMTDKYNMSLVCKWDNDSINYSFNNKDNILDEYNRDLIASKQKYKHLEIKYNASISDSRETIQSLEKENKISYNKGIEYYRGYVMPTIDAQYKSLEIEKNEEIDSFNVSIQFLEKVNKGNNEEIDALTMVNESLREINTKIVKEHNEIKILYVKQDYLHGKGNIEWNKKYLNQGDTLVDLQNKYNKSVLEKKRLEEQVTMELQNNLNQGNTLVDLQTKYNSSNRLYYGLFTYMLYNMSYHIYMYPYSVTNWLLLSGSSLFVYIDIALCVTQ